MYLPPVAKQEKTEYNNVDYIRKNNYTNSKNLDRNIKKAINKLPEKIRKLINDTTFEISKSNSYYDRKNNVIHLLSDSNEYETLHEIGHAIETKLDLLHDGFDINKIDKRIKAKIEELTNKYDSIQNPVQIRKSK